jgi:hypothetical protein
MKKVLFIVGIAVVSLSSCVKDYTCKCTATDANGNASASSSTINGKKSDVKVSCDEGDYSLLGVTVDCEIQ